MAGKEAVHPWRKWYRQTLDALEAIPEPPTKDDPFLHYYYKGNVPCIRLIPYWKALDWTLPLLREKVGEVTIEYQKGRASNQDYEMQAPSLKANSTFNEFADQIDSGPINDVYITAGNHAFNCNRLRPLYEDIGKLPPCLHPDVEAGFFWIGGATITPLHHDLTNNMLCQVMGEKLIRVVSPTHFDKLQHRAGVHSSIGWLSEHYADKHRIPYIDYTLRPGMALFLPVGWWHCCMTEAPSVTIAYTNFLWNNSFFANFRC